MDWNQITTSFLTACVPALATYFVTKKQMDSKIKEVELQSANEIKRLEKETELRLKETQQNQQMELATKFFTGELDLGKAMVGIQQLNYLNELTKTLPKK
ncbi:hypothetical protein [Streptococcus suis]|uniref:Phage protein n=1 Tax=Streptococcus suis TaxID=1307 RepID=A0AB33UDA2_STRSU|nr:hypothetical protein [Streptococcus suis]QBX21577.1 hypothetical protein Javan583_0008 [Streptococcus phage Javan583]MBY4959013.1 hypothetical protein [Streptococcus suis]MCQ9227049.1 hypothetical protein [Streptococcus suis]MCQ9229326.1 hypothetical protein [Streptococcus suis]MCQ9243318.1 hypothetical protein [Streptococcus suis]